MDLRKSLADFDTNIDAVIKQTDGVSVDLIAKLLHKKAVTLSASAVATSIAPLIGRKVDPADLARNAAGIDMTAPSAKTAPVPEKVADAPTVKGTDSSSDAKLAEAASSK